jgi:hypothetical protein
MFTFSSSVCTVSISLHSSQSLCLGLKRGSCIRLTTSLPYLSWLSRQYGSLNISQSYCPPEPVTGITFFLLLFLISQQHCVVTIYYWRQHHRKFSFCNLIRLLSCWCWYFWVYTPFGCSSVAVSEVYAAFIFRVCYVNNVVSPLKSVIWKQDSWLPRWVVISKAFFLRWVSSMEIVLLLHACLNYAATWDPSLYQTFQWFPLFEEWWNNMGISVEVSFAKTVSSHCVAMVSIWNTYHTRERPHSCWLTLY